MFEYYKQENGLSAYKFVAEDESVFRIRHKEGDSWQWTHSDDERSDTYNCYGYVAAESDIQAIDSACDARLRSLSDEIESLLGDIEEVISIRPRVGNSISDIVCDSDETEGGIQ